MKKIILSLLITSFGASLASAGTDFSLKDQGDFFPVGHRVEFADRYGWRNYSVTFDFSLEGGRSTKSGRQLRFDGQYSLNPKGQPHSAFISVETTSLVVYSGEPDEIKSISVVDIEQAKQ